MPKSSSKSVAKSAVKSVSKSVNSASKVVNSLMTEQTLTCILLVVVIGLLIYTAMLYTENFENHPEGVSAKFVMYYADWCPHCVKAKPEMKELKKMLKKNNNKVNNKQVNVVLVDAEKEKDKAKEANVQGFPTIILEDGDEQKEYRGARNAQSFMKFLENNL